MASCEAVVVAGFLLSLEDTCTLMTASLPIAPTPPQNEAQKTAAEARTLLERLNALKAETYPSLQIVRVESPRYHGYGIVWRDDEPSHLLAVRLSNENIWHYPLEHCFIADRSECPDWAKKAVAALKRRRTVASKRIPKWAPGRR